MKLTNPYNEYSTCTKCGFKKYCRFTARQYICKACDIKTLTEKKS